jgi:hypothetical protein
MHFFPPSFDHGLVDKQPQKQIYCKPAQKARKFGHPGRIGFATEKMMSGLHERLIPDDAVSGGGQAECEAVAVVDIVDVIDDDDLEMLEIIEIELYASSAKRKPRARIYVFRVGKQRIEVKDPIITGSQILELAHKLPPENYILRQIFHGAEPKVIGLDETVDLRAPGVERFRAMPRTAKDGM